MLRKIISSLKKPGLVLSAFLLVFTYPPYNFSFLAWVALVPLFFAIQKTGLKERFVTGYLFGVLFFSGVLYWLINVTIPGAIIVILLLSFAPAIFASLCRPEITGGRSVMYIPAAWVATEYLRTYLFTGFPWALLGYSQSANLPVIQIADITGVYGVSFLVVLVNFGIYLVLVKAPKRFYISFFIFVLFGLVVIYGNSRIRRIYPAQKIRIAVIQGNISQENKWDSRRRKFIIDKYRSLTAKAMEQKPHLIIWPETSVPGYLEERDLKNQIINIAESGKVHLLVGTLRMEGKKDFNSAVLISDEGKILQSYDKIHLVPFGEFIPFAKILSWTRGFIDKPIGSFDRGSDFTVFRLSLNKSLVEPGRIQKITEFHRFSVLICFEDIFPGISRKFVKKGARFLVNITNDAWFGKSSAPYQHAEGSIFRAIENRVPVIRAANTGFSCIIDHSGKILNSVRDGDDEIFVDGYAVEVVESVFTKTVYTHFGDVFSWACIALVIIGMRGKMRKCHEKK